MVYVYTDLIEVGLILDQDWGWGWWGFWLILRVSGVGKWLNIQE